MQSHKMLRFVRLARLGLAVLGMVGSLASANGCAAPTAAEPGDPARSVEAASTSGTGDEKATDTPAAPSKEPTVTSTDQQKALSLFEKSGGGSEGGACKSPRNDSYYGSGWSYVARWLARDEAEMEARADCRQRETRDSCLALCDSAEFDADCRIVEVKGGIDYWLCDGEIFLNGGGLAAGAKAQGQTASKSATQRIAAPRAVRRAPSSR